MRSVPTARLPLPAALGPALVRWYRRERRALPWRRNREPYRVWVAEVLLQQTRVAQAVPYFERFVRAFPTVEALAHAPVGRVLKLWEGAGYYARAHRLHEAAKQVLREYGGTLPRTVSELETLPGVGPYIARAVAAIAFGEPTVALEANGLRVAARWTREEGDVRDPRVRARLEGSLASVLPSRDPGTFNEAVMELGETVCRPALPDCLHCPVAFGCRARRELDDPGTLPKRSRPFHRPHVRAAVVALFDGDRVLVQRRPATGLLPGLWEFPGGKIRRGERPATAARRELGEETGLRVGELVDLGTVRHGYSHFTVALHVFVGRAGTPSFSAKTSSPRRWVTRAELYRLPLPKATEKVIALLDAEGRAFPGSRSRRGRTRALRRREGPPRRPRAPRQDTDV